MTKAHTKDIRAIIQLWPDVADKLQRIADDKGMTIDEVANWILEQEATVLDEF